MLVRDRLYGNVEVPLDPGLLDLPPIRRLRMISLSNVPPRILSKVGFLPGISDRLEHSLGVAHLAKYHDRDLVVAALFHDSGLPPFSHMVEHLMGEDHEKRSARIARELGFSRASEILAGRHPLSWMISSGLDLDNVDNVARFLVTGMGKSPSYDPQFLARRMDASRGCFSDLAQVERWLGDRRRLYSALYSWPNLSPHSVMTTLIESLHLEGIIDEEFFTMTDEEAMRVLLKHRRRRMDTLFSGSFPREILRLEGTPILEWEARYTAEREIERRLGKETFTIFLFSGKSKEWRRLRIPVCGGSEVTMGRESEPITVVFAYFRPSGEELKIIRSCIESGC